MRKYNLLLSLAQLLLCLCIASSSTAQQQKSLKESFADLKKSFHPDKSFILPFSDSTNEDLQAFLYAVKDTKGVRDAKLKMENKKAVILVDAKGSMVSLWNNLPKEMRTRYTVEERTPEGFVLSDSYQSAIPGNKKQ